MAWQGNMKWYLFAIFLLSFFVMFWCGGKTHAYTIQAHFIDRANIQIDKFEIDDNDMSNLSRPLVEAKFTKDDINGFLRTQVVGKGYKDGNIFDNTYQYHKDSCDEGNTIDTTNEGGLQEGQMWFLPEQLHINTKTNTAEGSCNYLFSTGTPKIEFKVDGKDGANTWFRRKDAQTLVRVDGRGGEFSNKDSGNANVYQSTTKEDGANGSCINGGYPNVIIDDSTKTNPLATGKYQTCVNDQRSSDGFVSIKIDNRGPGGSGGEVVGEIPSTTNGQPQQSCQGNNIFDMAWWACGMLGMIDSGLESATTALASLLSVNAEDFASQQLYTVWSYFRAVASFLLIGTALVMIIGQALSGD